MSERTHTHTHKYTHTYKHTCWITSNPCAIRYASALPPLPEYLPGRGNGHVSSKRMKQRSEQYLATAIACWRWISCDF